MQATTETNVKGSQVGFPHSCQEAGGVPGWDLGHSFIWTAETDTYKEQQQLCLRGMLLAIVLQAALVPLQLLSKLLIRAIIHLGVAGAAQRRPGGCLLLRGTPAVYLGVHIAPPGSVAPCKPGRTANTWVACHRHSATLVA